MSAFEIKNDSKNGVSVNDSVTCFCGRVHSASATCSCGGVQGTFDKKVKDECLVALKIYDSCRQQYCCTHHEMGPARAAENTCVGDMHHKEGDIIVPPHNAAAVTIGKLMVKKIIIVNKEPCQFKNGYWDINLKYVFEYRLTFQEADGGKIGSVLANSIFNKKVTLFGSVGTDLFIATDLFKSNGENTMIDAEPFVQVEAKAIALNAEIRTRREEVAVTIGLFTIVKIFRIVDLIVESKGFCIPHECEEICPLNPCEFFENLDFPMDVFAPPQKPEFLAGISGDIPKA
jgi:hypothetical protein